MLAAQQRNSVAAQPATTALMQRLSHFTPRRPTSRASVRARTCSFVATVKLATCLLMTTQLRSAPEVMNHETRYTVSKGKSRVSTLAQITCDGDRRQICWRRLRTDMHAPASQVDAVRRLSNIRTSDVAKPDIVCEPHAVPNDQIQIQLFFSKPFLVKNILLLFNSLHPCCVGGRNGS